MPAGELSEFVRSLALRIAGFPAAGHIAIKDRVNAIALVPAEDLRRDSEVFGVGLRNPEAQDPIQAGFKRGTPKWTWPGRWAAPRQANQT